MTLVPRTAKLGVSSVDRRRASRQEPLSLRRGRVREDIAEFVDDFLPDLVFEEIIVARSAQHSRFENFVLLVKQFIEFESHLLGAMVCHRFLCDEWRAKGQAALGCRAPLTVSTNTDTFSDFDISPEIPMVRAACSETASGLALYRMSGTAGIICLNTRAASTPFITGMAMSSTIKSG